MNRQEAREALIELGHAIGVAVMILRPHKELIEQFKKERRDMDAFGCFVDPTLWLNQERRATEAVMAPLYDAALKLIETHDQQMDAAKTALAKVKP
ncbi:hypothetical protein [Rhodomicrobium lacus]|uniref:hypothetical protein n=1 Tax=Rhodomicrobium lacus TaxID=2498452 RepID=UPI000F8CA789|nr:hypothetical protein [Rhodomicrobium lacus]